MTTTHPLIQSTMEAFTIRDAAFAALTGSAPALVRVIEIVAHEAPTYANRFSNQWWACGSSLRAATST